jgi:hypothetical protein
MELLDHMATLRFAGLRNCQTVKAVNHFTFPPECVRVPISPHSWPKFVLCSWLALLFLIVAILVGEVKYVVIFGLHFLDG